MAEERVERRLAAILAGDVAGYSRLMGADEEGTLSRLKAHRREFLEPKIAEHRGRIVKRTGDGVLVEFVSAVDAARCAVEIQQGMFERNASVPQETRIEIRYGIHIGDIIIEEDDIFGDGVNIAARLEGIAQPGGICISDDAYRQIRGKIDANFQDKGEHGLKNIAQPIRIYEWQVGGSVTQAISLALPDKPSIAVLPFQNMSGDPEQEYFADGIVEEIITGLSRLRWLFVIARNSSFTYKGRAVDVRQVGRELGVRYVLEGSVRKGGQRLRITAQLVEAATGNHLWADRYDGALDDVFDLQDRITLDVVRAIEPSVQMAEIERARRKRPENLDAYDHFLRALPHIWNNNPAEASKALEQLEAALRIDPNYAMAHAYIGMCFLVLSRHSRDPGDVASAILHARTALVGSIDDPSALAWAGFVLAILDRDYVTARSAFNRALSIDPDSAITLGFCALVNAFAGQYDAAIEFADKANRSSPLDPLLYQTDLGRGLAHLHSGRYTDAIHAFQHAIEVVPRFGVPRMLLAAAYSSSGRMDEARAAVQHLLEVEPNLCLQTLDTLVLGPPDKMEALRAALQKAGLPE